MRHFQSLLRVMNIGEYDVALPLGNPGQTLETIGGAENDYGKGFSLI
jgi:hypothetical protein